MCKEAERKTDNKRRHPSQIANNAWDNGHVPTFLTALCELLMCSDPWPQGAGAESETIIKNRADVWSRNLGFENWIEAYHGLWSDECKGSDKSAEKCCQPTTRGAEAIPVQDRNTKIMRAIYDSEIDVSVASQWDGGYRLKVGNGCMEPFIVKGEAISDTSCADKYSQMVNDIAELAIENYPDSTFAKRCASGEFESA